MQPCKMPDCERPVADRRGKPGAPARYCDDEDHNGQAMQAATRARERDDRRRRNAADAPDPELPPERQVYAFVARQVVGRISLLSKVGITGSARPRCTSLGRFQAMASWGRVSLYSMR